MRRLCALLALGLVPALASGGPSDPITWLRHSAPAAAARFELAHATYSVWQLRWRQPSAELRLTFASNARSAAEAGQLRELTVEAVTPGGRAASPAQERAVLAATRALARHCGLTLPRAATPQRALTVTLPAGARPTCLTPTP